MSNVVTIQFGRARRPAQLPHTQVALGKRLTGGITDLEVIERFRKGAAVEAIAPYRGGRRREVQAVIRKYINERVPQRRAA